MSASNSERAVVLKELHTAPLGPNARPPTCPVRSTCTRLRSRCFHPGLVIATSYRRSRRSTGASALPSPTAQGAFPRHRGHQSAPRRRDSELLGSVVPHRRRTSSCTAATSNITSRTSRRGPAGSLRCSRCSRSARCSPRSATTSTRRPTSSTITASATSAIRLRRRHSGTATRSGGVWFHVLDTEQPSSPGTPQGAVAPPPALAEVAREARLPVPPSSSCIGRS